MALPKLVPDAWLHLTARPLCFLILNGVAAAGEPQSVRQTNMEPCPRSDLP